MFGVLRGGGCMLARFCFLSTFGGGRVDNGLTTGGDPFFSSSPVGDTTAVTACRSFAAARLMLLVGNVRLRVTVTAPPSARVLE